LSHTSKAFEVMSGITLSVCSLGCRDNFEIGSHGLFPNFFDVPHHKTNLCKNSGTLEQVKGVKSEIESLWENTWNSCFFKFFAF